MHIKKVARLGGLARAKKYSKDEVGKMIREGQKNSSKKIGRPKKIK